MKNLTLTQAILNFSFSTDSGTPTEHLQLVSSKNIHWFRFYDFFSVKFCVDFFLTVSYLTNYPMTMCQVRVQFAGNEIFSMNHVIRNKFE